MERWSRGVESRKEVKWKDILLCLQSNAPSIVQETPVFLIINLIRNHFGSRALKHSVIPDGSMSASFLCCSILSLCFSQCFQLEILFFLCLFPYINKSHSCVHTSADKQFFIPIFNLIKMTLTAVHIIDFKNGFFCQNFSHPTQAGKKNLRLM